jgi:NitT/TauT family transport system ATP-binding protein
MDKEDARFQTLEQLHERRKQVVRLHIVDTPKQDVRFTALGKKFIAADRVGRRTIFSEQVFKLRLFHIIIALLREHEEVEADRVIKDISSALPYDNPERVFLTMIAWGRYAGLMDINNKTRMVFVPEEDAEVSVGHKAAPTS